MCVCELCCAVATAKISDGIQSDKCHKYWFIFFVPLARLFVYAGRSVLLSHAYEVRITFMMECGRYINTNTIMLPSRRSYIFSHLISLFSPNWPNRMKRKKGKKSSNKHKRARIHDNGFNGRSYYYYSIFHWIDFVCAFQHICRFPTRVSCVSDPLYDAVR